MSKKIHKIFSLTMIFLSACAALEGAHRENKQAQERCLMKPTEIVTINIIDRNGLSQTFTNKDRIKEYQKVDFLKNQPYQKVLRVFARDKQGNIRAIVTSYHPNGQIKQYLEIVNSRAFGIYREWFQNGVMKLDTNVIGGSPDLNIASERSWLFHGINKVWGEDGNLMAEIPYNKGELEGPSIYYHTNGKKWKNVPFVKGKIEGNFEIFQPEGKLLQTTTYLDGNKSGKSLRYWQDNRISSEEYYEKGLLTKGRYYDFKNNLAAEIVNGNGYRAVYGKDSIIELQEHRKGILDGEVKVFGKDGLIAQTYHNKNGIKHGEEINYQEGSTKPYLSLNWYEGKIQGLVKTWYDNGNMESQREISGNKKNGLCLAWYYDGNLMLIEEYQDDKLVRGEYYKKGEKIPLTEVMEGKGTTTLFDPEGNFLRKISYVNGAPLD